LRKLLEVKAAASTTKTMLKELLKACHKLKIYGAVLDDLRGKVYYIVALFLVYNTCIANTFVLINIYTSLNLYT
jgi:hypothetical protein